MSDIDKITPGQKPTAADKLVVAISESTGHQGRVINKSHKWPAFCEKLSRTNRDSLTTKEFLKLSETAQHKRKNTGFFVGGHFTKGARKLEALQTRSVLTLDIDRCSVDTAWSIFKPTGDTWLSEHEYMAYTTRSHTPASPRARVVIPLLAPIHPDLYEPLTRIIAQKLDPAMETVDPISFRPAQIMYLPSTNQDADFREKRNRGRLLDADAMLAEFGDWKNWDNLPRSPREVKPRLIAKKAQDPTTKRGWIGAFCRTYTVYDVIDKFLSDVYQAGETGADGTERFTYIKGSTTNGVVIYEDGKFVFSWHGTDPAGGRLSNSFELYRIHLFGHLDRPEDIEAAEEASDPTLLPSYKAAIKAMQEDAEVVGEYTRSQYDQEAMADDAEFDLEDEDVLAPEVNSDDDISTKANKEPSQEVDEPAAEPAKPDAWLDDLDITDKGSVKNTLHNLILILQHDKRFKGAIGYNQFTSMVVLIRRIRSKQYGHDTGPIINRGTGDLITGASLAVIRAILEGPRGENKSGWGLRVVKADLDAAVERVGMDSQFHPVRAYIKNCAWDGVPRMRKLFHTYFHTPDDPYFAEVSELWLTATCARIFEPGHKVDSSPILEGPEGLGKTTGPKALWPFPDWTGQFDADPSKPEKVVENLQGKVFVEIPELITLLRSDTEYAKAFFSATVVRTRLAWERGAKEYYRQNTFYGTTNEREYFRDRQGNRRYWPVPIRQMVDIAGMKRDRDLIWGEVYQTYLWMRRMQPEGDLPFYIQDPKVAAYAQREQASRVVQDEYANLQGQVEAWLDEPVPEAQAKPGCRRDEADDVDATAKDEKLVQRTVVCINDVLTDCLEQNVNKGIANRANPVRRMLGAILSSAPGWEKGKNAWCGVWGSQQQWVRKQEL